MLVVVSPSENFTSQSKPRRFRAKPSRVLAFQFQSRQYTVWTVNVSVIDLVISDQIHIIISFLSVFHNIIYIFLFSSEFNWKFLEPRWNFRSQKELKNAPIRDKPSKKIVYSSNLGSDSSLDVRKWTLDWINSVYDWVNDWLVITLTFKSAVAGGFKK